MATPDILDHGRRTAALERKVSELYERLAQAEPWFGGDSGSAERPRRRRPAQGHVPADRLKTNRLGQDRAPALESGHRACPSWLARARIVRGTCGLSLKAASFRT
jgi:hypothetical protein